MSNTLKPIPVSQLLVQVNDQPEYRFFIPSFQRGFRWDEDQVTDLLEDLREFIYSPPVTTGKYCLQPIVVKKEQDNSYAVLDGQQRLTTLFILISRLRKKGLSLPLYTLSYRTRPDSATFLGNLQAVANSTNPDYHYISKAYITIDNWLNKESLTQKDIEHKFADALQSSVEFIWYEVGQDADPIDIFTRINIGKIALTNAELVKAVFLSKNNLEGFADTTNHQQALTLKQSILALEWEQIEKALQDPSFWGFIYQGAHEFETRMDYLLDLHTDKKAGDKNKYHAFRHFYKQVNRIRQDKGKQQNHANKGQSFMEEQWDKLKNLFDTLYEWYHDKTFNHLIGFLIHEKTDIPQLQKEFKKTDRSAFLQMIREKIALKIISADISILRYTDSNHKNKLNKLLLLHNITNSLLTPGGKSYFPFEALNQQDWSLEHIFAQNSEELREKDYHHWLKEHLPYFKSFKDETADKIADNIKNLLMQDDTSINKETMQACFSDAAKYIQERINNDDKTNAADAQIAPDEYDWLNDDHSIANLALLDGSTNSAIKNSLFDIKRKMILDKDKKGLFIPHETKKVFLKYYTESPQHLAYWTFQDRKAYVDNITTTLSYFLKTNL
ncbi:DUF262 domain-containing protein [Chitinophaga sp. HK235]|uniref:DUF262 domain-containing protein n=1 Tax=Chitinophaga sp. HK235 TaxID=2952571 RepID=UPI001BAA4722|nr:DUF262 domain-containing protein [Chitinophaga sp. HK235]